MAAGCDNRVLGGLLVPPDYLWMQPLVKKSEHRPQCVSRGMTFVIHEMLRQYGVRVRGYPEGIARLGGNFDPDKSVAEMGMQRVETLARTESILAEAQPQQMVPDVGSMCCLLDLLHGNAER